MLLDKEVIEQADVIIGVNKENGAETIFFGESLLKLIASGYEEPKSLACKVLRVLVDFSDESDEPERLAAACLAWKESCDAPSDSHG
jgi:hypothetical protein